LEPTTLAPTFVPITLAPTFVPTTLAPTFVPTTLAPTLEPTFAPTTLAPTFAPITLAPTFAPTTLAPTLEPTLAPTFAPTFAPTLEPTSQIQFTVTGLLNNVSTPTLSLSDQESVITATAMSMNISDKFVIFASQTNQRRKLLQQYNILYETMIKYPIPDVSSAQLVYNSLITSLINAVNTGNFNNYLYQAATINNATNMLTAKLINVTNTNYVVIVNKPKPKHKSLLTTNQKRFLLLLLLVCVPPLLYLKYLRYKKTSEQKRKYQDRRDYYFSVIFGRNNDSNNFTPVVNV
jgi:hypothetical protein